MPRLSTKIYKIVKTKHIFCVIDSEPCSCCCTFEYTWIFVTFNIRAIEFSRKLGTIFVEKGNGFCFVFQISFTQFKSLPHQT